ncbi:MAG: hypothetical protein KY428_00330 [Bacteroidetes bacterium]|nr:hypothetical protein [Bacteroidota bacterium]
MQKLLAVFLLSSIACIGSACDPGPEATILIPKEYKAYVDFPVGSWWVYEDVNDPAKRDSVYVFGELKRMIPSKHKDIEYEGISNRVVFKHLDRIDSITFRLTYDVFSYSSGVDYFQYLAAIPAQGIMGLEMLFFPNQVGDSSFVYECGIHVTDKKDTLKVGKDTYHNTITTAFPVGEFSSCYEAPPYFILSETYAKGVGVVRRQYADGSVYELAAYHINR